jgi:predicted acyltransferase
MTSPPQERLQSLDAFRGATIAAMILVNNPGSWGAVYPQLAHARWNGWTMTDFIFPFFLWIVGVAMTISFAARKERGRATGKLMPHVLRRSAVIFGLGLFLAGFPFGLLFGERFSLETIRIPGVLQRIAVCYLIGSAIILHSGVRGQILWIAVLLTAYWLALMLIPVPGYGAGVLEPTGNLAWWIDAHVLAGHTWGGAPAPGFDPEGILSTVPAVATLLLGALTGTWLRTFNGKEEKTAWMFVTGNLFLLAGAVLDMWMPINKNLWTSSFVVFMAGWALTVFSMFYWLLDVKGYGRPARPAVIFGMNAIAVYVLSGILGHLMNLITWTRPDGSAVSVKDWVYETLFVPYFSPLNASVLFAAAFVLAMYAAAWTLWKKKIFLRA